MRVSSDSNKTPLGQADIAYVQTVVEQVALAHHLKKDPPPVHSPRYLSSYHRGIPDPYVPSPAIWVTLSEDSQSLVIQYQGVTLGQQVKLEILNKLKERFGAHRVSWTNKNSGEQ